MRIGFIGAGKMTEALGKRFRALGHELLVSYSRDPARLAALATALGGGTRTGSATEASAFAEVVVLTVRWDGMPGALAAAGPLEGKVLWTIVNPLKADLSGLVVGTTTSGSEEIAARAQGARLVAGWPPFADVLASASTRIGSEQQTLFYCGDDEPAKRKVLPLFEALDVEPIDCGPLRAARFIEPAMLLLVHLASVRRMGQVGARVLHRGPRESTHT